jgi:hypothetical protein
MRALAILAVVGLLFATLPSPASAQTQAEPAAPSTAPAAPPPPANAPMTTAPTEPPQAQSDDARYSFHRVPDGYLRLDSSTGRVALCSRRQVGWACQVVPDDRNVLESEIARLQTENGTLKRLLLSRGIPLPSGVRMPPVTGDKGEATPPGESVFDRFASVVAATWRRLVDVVARIQRDMSKDG